MRDGNHLMPSNSRDYRAPVLMVLILIFAVAMLCSSSAGTTENYQTGTMDWNAQQAAAALRKSGDNYHQRMRGLVALHRNARLAISALGDASTDPAARDQAMKLLADIERELAKAAKEARR